MGKKIGMLLIGMSFIAAFSASARELTAKEKALIEKEVRPQLKDPDSAKFTWQDYQGGITYCFYVNAKNSYGGYVGDSPVVSTVLQDAKGTLSSASVTVYSGDNRNIGRDICTSSGYKG